MQVRILILVPLACLLLVTAALCQKGTQRSSSATPAATPYPTPTYDPESYIPQTRPGKTVTVAGDNLADKIQAAQNDPTVAIVKIEGGGSISKQVTLRKHTIFDSATYSCDTRGITDQGQFLIADGVRVEGTWRLPKALIDYYKLGNGRNWKDPYLQKVQALTADELAGTGTTSIGTHLCQWPISSNPSLSVVRRYDWFTHRNSSKYFSHRISHQKCRQKIYDGGVRSTILMGNCVRCTAQNNYLEDTGSIGISFGGSGLEKNNYSDQGLIRPTSVGVAAANFAAVNSENLLVIENYSRQPGHHEPKFGGGVCGFDLETNSTADHSKNIQVFN